MGAGQAAVEQLAVYCISLKKYVRRCPGLGILHLLKKQGIRNKNNVETLATNWDSNNIFIYLANAVHSLKGSRRITEIL